MLTMKTVRRLFRVSLRFVVFLFTVGAAAMVAIVFWKTAVALRPLPEDLNPTSSAVRKAQILDRNGLPLSVTYLNQWNIHDYVPLHEMPLLLRQAFVEAEDQRFYSHSGVDWAARLHALLQNVAAVRIVRGASTITEQVVRMLHPRPRTIWSRWIEGIEAGRLEARFSKAEILEFYLNQVPYAGQRRGAAQAARLYFDRDLDTLSPREMLSLAILVRAPSTLDLRREGGAMEKAMERLAARLHQRNRITDIQHRSMLTGGCSLAKPHLSAEAGHFVRYLYQNVLQDAERRNSDWRKTNPNARGKILATLDASLQERVQRILDSRLKDLRTSGVTNGAVLVLDHQTDEVLAWVNGGAAVDGESGSWIDAVTTPRQPGSTLKPFLYALALEMGWTPATLIDDSPLAQAVGVGIHTFHNYSRTHYGHLRLRDALGNSLNIPAVRTVQFIGTNRFLQKLHDLGFHSLTRSPDTYGEGLALGNGEVSLLELVQAYAVLARQGVFRPPRLILRDDPPREAPRRIFSEESASLIAHILSDPQARRLEFGDGNLLRFPVQTAAKTGTSNDHRDAWTVGFSQRYTVGAWMGNLDRRATDGVTGTTGPALVLRAVFAELNRHEELKPLLLSPRLLPETICSVSGLRAGPLCPQMQEWFVAAQIPRGICALHSRAGHGISGSQPSEDENGPKRLSLVQPTPDLQLAMDPHIPDPLEAFRFLLPKDLKIMKVEWIVNGDVVGVTGSHHHQFVWPLSRGTHYARARVWRSDAAEPEETPAVRFVVK